MRAYRPQNPQHRHRALKRRQPPHRREELLRQHRPRSQPLSTRTLVPPLKLPAPLHRPTPLRKRAELKCLAPLGTTTLVLRPLSRGQRRRGYPKLSSPRYRYVGGHVVGGGLDNNIRYDPYTNGSGRLLNEKRPRKAGATRALLFAATRRHDHATTWRTDQVHDLAGGRALVLWSTRARLEMALLLKSMKERVPPRARGKVVHYTPTQPPVRNAGRPRST
jgi:hypothetical protein